MRTADPLPARERAHLALLTAACFPKLQSADDRVPGVPWFGGQIGGQSGQHRRCAWARSALPRHGRTRGFDRTPEPSRATRGLELAIAPDGNQHTSRALRQAGPRAMSKQQAMEMLRPAASLFLPHRAVFIATTPAWFWSHPDRRLAELNVLRE